MQDDVAVIGAGIAGLAAASALAAAGRAVRVWEKSGAPGGRAATRERHGIRVDHGAPYAGITRPAFRTAAAGWQAKGHAALWPDADHAVGRPGMRDLAAPLAEGLEITWRCRVSALARTGDGWRLTLEDGGEARAGTVLLAVPAPQAAALLPGDVAVPGLAEVTMTPCWTVMAAFDTPLPGPDIVEGDGAPLALALRDAAKPGRAQNPDTWVLHAGADWTAERIEAAADGVGDALIAALAARLSRALPVPATRMVHRWRYARVARPLGRECHWDGAARLGLAGDWCTGPGIEAAWTSGRALAAALTNAG